MKKDTTTNFTMIKKSWANLPIPAKSKFNLLDMEERKNAAFALATGVATRRCNEINVIYVETLSYDEIVAEALYYAWDEEALLKVIKGRYNKDDLKTHDGQKNLFTRCLSKALYRSWKRGEHGVSDTSLGRGCSRVRKFKDAEGNRVSFEEFVDTVNYRLPKDCRVRGRSSKTQQFINEIDAQNAVFDLDYGREWGIIPKKERKHIFELMNRMDNNIKTIKDAEELYHSLRSC